MPLETATYLNQLVATNPVHTDGFNVADSHMRLIKSTLLATFPNLNAAVTASPADLNVVAGVAAGSALSVPAPSGSTTTGGTLILKGAPGVYADLTIQNASGVLTIQSGTTTIATIDATGNLNVPGLVKELTNTLIPHGVIVMWSGSAASIPAGWYLCNGSNGTPNLVNQFVLAADDVTVTHGTSGGTNNPTVTTALSGVHNHGGTTGSYQLQVADLPAHTHPEYATLNTTAGGTGNVAQGTIPSLGGGSATSQTTGSTGSNNPHSHTIAQDNGHTHTVTVPTPAYYALCYIMKA